MTYTAKKVIYISKDKLIRDAFDKIKKEMTDHLQTINENTKEINSSHDFVLHLENMINKLNERLDEVEHKINELSGKKVMTVEDFKGIVLKPKEQEIFSILYQRTGDLIDYREISKTLGITEQSVQKHISRIVNKGIPIIKKYFDNNVYLVLDSDFRNLQAKYNIIKIKE